MANFKKVQPLTFIWFAWFLEGLKVSVSGCKLLLHSCSL